MNQFDWITPKWPAPDNVACISTTRQGGCSQGKYASFNLGAHVGDNTEHVNKNRSILNQQLHLSDDPMWLDQQHGAKIIDLSLRTTDNLQADAAFVTVPGIVCAVLTADCLPVLFCDPHGKCVAVAHAGWRGLLKGVLEQSLSVLYAKTNKILCWLGPAIGPNKFEVGSEVKDQFMHKDSRHESAFQEKQPGKYLANIYLLAEQTLTAQGVDAIYGGNYCTFSDNERFYSYRRDGETGRMATIIWLKS